LLAESWDDGLASVRHRLRHRPRHRLRHCRRHPASSPSPSTASSPPTAVGAAADTSIGLCCVRGNGYVSQHRIGSVRRRHELIIRSPRLHIDNRRRTTRHAAHAKKALSIIEGFVRIRSAATALASFVLSTRGAIAATTLIVTVKRDTMVRRQHRGMRGHRAIGCDYILRARGHVNVLATADSSRAISVRPHVRRRFVAEAPYIVASSASSRDWHCRVPSKMLPRTKLTSRTMVDRTRFEGADPTRRDRRSCRKRLGTQVSRRRWTPRAASPWHWARKLRTNSSLSWRFQRSRASQRRTDVRYRRRRETAVPPITIENGGPFGSPQSLILSGLFTLGQTGFEPATPSPPD
jgi:hypothetical protein